MAVVINTNVDSVKIQSLLNTSTTKMSKTMERLSSGLKILSARDDAAGTVISAKMNVQLNGNKIAQQNVQNANALMSTVEGNLDVIESNISRIRDLTLQAKNSTYSKTEIQAMQDEVAERMKEIDRVNNSATFSSLRLFGEKVPGSVPATAIGLAAEGATFQVGSNGGVDNTIEADKKLFQSVEFSCITGIKLFDLTQLADTATANIQWQQNNVSIKDFNAITNLYDKAIASLDYAIDNITNRKSVIGSAGNRLDSALETLVIQNENLTSAKSIITDSDIAAEASTFTQNQILQQVSTSLLAQANQAPSIALSLV